MKLCVQIITSKYKINRSYKQFKLGVAHCSERVTQKTRSPSEPHVHFTGMMSKSGIDLLLCLPTALSCEILSTWLYVPNIAKLDSAYCNLEKRAMFHALYEQPELVCPLDCGPSKNALWIFKRRIRMNNFTASAELPIDVAVSYLQDFGQCIRSVTLSSCVCDVVANAIAEHCPRVSKLKLDNVYGVSFALLNTFQNIEYLELFHTSFAEPDISTSNNFKLLNVRKLRILWSNLAFEDILFLLEKCLYVTHLSLIFSRTFPTVSAVEAISRLTRLVTLNMGGLYIDDAALAAIAHNCSAIVNLDLSSCREITDEGIKAVATKLKLKVITLACDEGLTDKSLEYLEYCRVSLETLHIKQTVGLRVRTNKLTLPAVKMFVKTPQNKCQYNWVTFILTRVDCILETCAHATTIVVAIVLTDKLLFQIAESCVELEYLHIYTGHNVYYTSTSFYALFNSCSKLKVISPKGKMNNAHLKVVLATHGKYFTFSSASPYDIMNIP